RSGPQGRPAPRRRPSLPQRRLVPGARKRRFRNGHADRFELAAVATELARARRAREVIEEMPGQEFGGGVGTLELRQLVEVAIVERGERFLEQVVGTGEVDDEAVGAEFVGEEVDG